ncbi:MAG: hypothetical protein L0H70_06475 [Xanthomonadales bacterium]|nr:hypothetical protein [Xanthomonadales bacterium]
MTADYHLGEGIIEKTMQQLLPGRFDTPAARAMLLAIGAQESGFRERIQVGGPARGYWQFEQGGGVHCVLTHSASRMQAKACCLMRAVAPVASDVYAALASDDLLACAFARLLLWTDPDPLPGLGDVDKAWAYYRHLWRPGYPHAEAWQLNYCGALDAAHFTAGIA